VSRSGTVKQDGRIYGASETKATADFVQRVLPHPSLSGRTPGLLGFMFWAAERPSTRGVTTQPPNSCEGGMGVGCDNARHAAADGGAPPELGAGVRSGG
jgi:hypothetical protein